MQVTKWREETGRCAIADAILAACSLRLVRERSCQRTGRPCRAIPSRPPRRVNQLAAAAVRKKRQVKFSTAQRREKEGSSNGSSGNRDRHAGSRHPGDGIGLGAPEGPCSVRQRCAYFVIVWLASHLLQFTSGRRPETAALAATTKPRAESGRSVGLSVSNHQQSERARATCPSQEARTHTQPLAAHHHSNSLGTRFASLSTGDSAMPRYQDHTTR